MSVIDTSTKTSIGTLPSPGPTGHRGGRIRHPCVCRVGIPQCCSRWSTPPRTRSAPRPSPWARCHRDRRVGDAAPGVCDERNGRQPCRRSTPPRSPSSRRSRSLVSERGRVLADLPRRLRLQLHGRDGLRHRRGRECRHHDDLSSAASRSESRSHRTGRPCLWLTPHAPGRRHRRHDQPPGRSRDRHRRPRQRRRLRTGWLGGYVTVNPLSGAGDLVVLDLANRAISARLGVDSGPVALAVLPTGSVYVVNTGSLTMSVVAVVPAASGAFVERGSPVRHVVLDAADLERGIARDGLSRPVPRALGPVVVARAGRRLSLCRGERPARGGRPRVPRSPRSRRSARGSPPNR